MCKLDSRIFYFTRVLLAYMKTHVLLSHSLSQHVIVMILFGIPSYSPIMSLIRSKVLILFYKTTTVLSLMRVAVYRLIETRVLERATSLRVQTSSFQRHFDST